jgi:hypothetical protein
MAISRILSAPNGFGDAMIIYLIPLTRDAREPFRRSETAATERVMRRYPRINGPAVLPLFCLAPHGVFRASRIAPRAVSSYLAFSTLPALRCQRTGGVFSVTLSVNLDLRRGCPRVLRGMLPYGVRTFLWSFLQKCGSHQRSSAIARTLPSFSSREKALTTNTKEHDGHPNRFVVSVCGLCVRTRRTFSPDSQAAMTSTA